MDSITHIVVGATADYMVAGRTYGKRAMIWGALGGSMPDIDVISNLWTDPVDSLMAHRGITHSLLFLAFGSVLLTWLNGLFYKNDLQNGRNMRFFVASFLLVLAAVTALVMNVLLLSFDWLWLLLSIPFCIWGGVKLIKIFRNYVLQPNIFVKPDFRIVWLVFFVSMSTHLFLDTCTVYGTGLLEPFSNHRFALSNISVVDIFFTIPAVVIILLACVTHRGIYYTKINIAWMILYFALTFFNYQYMLDVFGRALDKKDIPVKKMLISPAIMNNFLWYSVAETDTAFVTCSHSLFGQASVPDPINILPKSYQLLPEAASSSQLNTLKAFSRGYYNLVIDKQGDVQWNDLKFGMFSDAPKDANDYLFKFKLRHDNGVWTAQKASEMNKSLAEFWPEYWKRVWGQ